MARPAAGPGGGEMDGGRFDRLAVAWAAGSRRRLLGAALAALGPLRPRRASADCPALGANCCRTDADCAGFPDAVCQFAACYRPPGGKCTRNRHCASGSCNRKKRRCRRCPEGQTACGGRCVTSCSNISPVHCVCCWADTCPTLGICCAGACSGGNCDCRPDNSACSANLDCCSNVCDRNGKCACVAAGVGCTRDAQCCSNRCDTGGRCAPFCPTGQPHCGGVCCPSGAHCDGGACLCDGTNQPPCGGVECCPPGAGCTPQGICLGGPGG